MKSKFLRPIIFLAAFSSCTTMYKSGQTPDDVYFSPGRTYAATAKQERQDPEPAYSDRDEAQIRMAINNMRWRYFDYDNDLSYNPYMYGYNYGYYYNPYYCPYPVYSNIIVVTNPKNTTPRTTNLAAYGTGYNNYNLAVNPKTGRTFNAPVRAYNNTNNGSRVGNTMRRVLPTNNNNNNNTDNNRTYNPPTNNNTNSSSSPASSSGSSSGGGSVTRPARGGK